MSKYNDTYNTLAKRLSRMAKIKSKYGESEEAWTLAHSLLDLEESFNRYLNDYMPRLKADGVSDEELEDILHQIGEEFSHVLYHIWDPQYYNYLPQNKSESHLA